MSHVRSVEMDIRDIEVLLRYSICSRNKSKISTDCVSQSLNGFQCLDRFPPRFSIKVRWTELEMKISDKMTALK